MNVDEFPYERVCAVDHGISFFCGFVSSDRRHCIYHTKILKRANVWFEDRDFEKSLLFRGNDLQVCTSTKVT